MSTKMSKLSFRAKPLDASKPMPVYINEELPGLPDYSAINRAVPQMPSGMYEEEECEHHLQRAICTGLIIPTPECTDVSDEVAYDRLYPSNFKMPLQLIRMQSFAMDQDIPDYDMDSEDELWFSSQKSKLEITPQKFEEMMDRLEKGLGQTVLSEQQAKALLKDDDDVILAVYDYWLNKRVKTQHSLIPAVRTEQHPGTAPENPYIAFRRHTEKMQTRKHRKNDETSYEKMLKLKRDLSRAVTLLELIKRREKTKREVLHLTVEVFEKRYQAGDFSGQMLAEVSAAKPCPRPAFTPLFPNQFSVNHQNWHPKEEPLPRKEKRPYKKRKHKAPLSVAGSMGSSTGVGGRTSVNTTASVTSGLNSTVVGTESMEMEGLSSDDGDASSGLLSGAAVSDDEDSGADGSAGPFVFRRRKNCSYHAPLAQGQGNWPWCSREDGGLADRRYRYCLTSLATPSPGRCVGFARRRIGRGGRVILDRAHTPMDDVFRSLDFTIFDSTDKERLQQRPTRHWKQSQPNVLPENPSSKHPNVLQHKIASDEMRSLLLQRNQLSKNQTSEVRLNHPLYTNQNAEVSTPGALVPKDFQLKIKQEVTDPTSEGVQNEQRLKHQLLNTLDRQGLPSWCQTTEDQPKQSLSQSSHSSVPSHRTEEQKPLVQELWEDQENEDELLSEIRNEWLHFRPVPPRSSGLSGSESGSIHANWDTPAMVDWGALRLDVETPNGGAPTEMTLFDVICNMPGSALDASFMGAGTSSDAEVTSRWGPEANDSIREDAGTQTPRQTPPSHQSNIDHGSSSKLQLQKRSERPSHDDAFIGSSQFNIHPGPSVQKPSPPQMWASISSSLHQAPGRPVGTNTSRSSHQHRKRERHHQHQGFSFFNPAGTSSHSNPPFSNGVSIIPVSVSAVLSANPGLLRQGLINGPAGSSTSSGGSSSCRRRAIPVFIKQEVVEEAGTVNEQFNCVSFGSASGTSPGESTAAGIRVSPASADSSTGATAAAAAAAAACSEQQKLKSNTTSQQQVLMEVT